MALPERQAGNRESWCLAWHLARRHLATRAYIVLVVMLPSLAVALAAVASPRSPPKFARGENNVGGSMPNPRGNPQAGVLLVGTFATASQCEAAATADPRAASWTYHECSFPPAGSGNYSCHCYARTSSYWHPTKQALVDSGYLRPGTPVPPPPPPSPPPPPLPGAPCKNNGDCQLNGACIDGKCDCDPAWTGSRCQRLNLLPASIDAGLQDAQLSSWGGSILQNATDGTWVTSPPLSSCSNGRIRLTGLLVCGYSICTRLSLSTGVALQRGGRTARSGMLPLAHPRVHTRSSASSSHTLPTSLSLCEYRTAPSLSTFGQPCCPRLCVCSVC